MRDHRRSLAAATAVTALAVGMAGMPMPSREIVIPPGTYRIPALGVMRGCTTGHRGSKKRRDLTKERAKNRAARQARKVNRQRAR